MKSALTSIKFWLALLASLLFGLGVSVKAAQQPGLFIASPVADEQITGSKVPVSLEVTSFYLMDYKLHPKAVAGQGHIHLWLDQSQPNPDSAIKVYSDSYVFENVAPGQHTLVAELVNNNHTSFDPPITSTVNFTTTLATVDSVGFVATPLVVSILAFLFLVVVLYFVTSHPKSKSNSGKSHQKSSSKSSNRSH